MKILHSNNFDIDFVDDKLKNGNLSVTNGILKASGTSNGDRAIKSFYYFNKGYSKVKVSVMTRVVTGEASIAVDGIASTTNYDNPVNIGINESNSKSWTKLQLEVIVPQGYHIIRITIGRFAGQNEPSEAYFKDPKIEIENDLTGSPTILAQGLIRMQNGVASIRPATRAFGFENIMYDATEKRVVVFTQSKIPNSTQGAYPTIHVTGTDDNFIIPLAGGFIGDRFTIKFTDGTQFVDISNMTLYFFVSVII